MTVYTHYLNVNISGYILCGMRTGIRAFDPRDRPLPQSARRARPADEQTERTLLRRRG